MALGPGLTAIDTQSSTWAGVASLHPGGQTGLFAKHGPRSPTGPPTICNEPPCGAVDAARRPIHSLTRSEYTNLAGYTSPNTQLAQVHNLAAVTGALKYRGARIPFRGDCNHAYALQSRCCLGEQSRPFDRPMLQGDPSPGVIELRASNGSQTAPAAAAITRPLCNPGAASGSNLAPSTGRCYRATLPQASSACQGRAQGLKREPDCSCRGCNHASALQSWCCLGK